MTGKVIDGHEAHRIGFANRIGPAEELDAVTEGFANELLACAPQAVGLAKRVMDAAAKPALAATLEQEVAAQQLLAASDDFAEGTRAFLEKRDAGVRRALGRWGRPRNRRRRNTRGAATCTSPTRSSARASCDVVVIPGFVTHLELFWESPSRWRARSRRLASFGAADGLRPPRLGDVGPGDRGAHARAAHGRRARRDGRRRLRARGPDRAVGGRADEHPVRRDLSGARARRSCSTAGWRAPPRPTTTRTASTGEALAESGAGARCCRTGARERSIEVSRAEPGRQPRGPGVLRPGWSA